MSRRLPDVMSTTLCIRLRKVGGRTDDGHTPYCGAARVGDLFACLYTLLGSDPTARARSIGLDRHGIAAGSGTWQILSLRVQTPELRSKRNDEFVGDTICSARHAPLKNRTVRRRSLRGVHTGLRTGWKREHCTHNGPSSDRLEQRQNWIGWKADGNSASWPNQKVIQPPSPPVERI